MEFRVGVLAIHGGSPGAPRLWMKRQTFCTIGIIQVLCHTAVRRRVRDVFVFDVPYLKSSRTDHCTPGQRGPSQF